MKTFNLLIAMLLGLFVVAGCSKSDAPLPPPIVEGVEVHLAAGSAAPMSRAAFSEGTPVAVYIYQREVAGVMNLEAAPYKIATGETSSAASADRSAIVLTGGDVSNGKLTLKTGYTYDFVMVVNPPSDPSKLSVGAVNSGVMGAIPHGIDLLAGRKEGIAVTEGMTAIEIAFTEFGADEKGNLPHLCSGISIEANATQVLINKLADKGGLNLSVASATFKRVAAEGRFTFSSSPLAVVPNPMGYKSSFRMTANSEPVKITSPMQTVLYDKGILLPYPLLSSNNYNVIDIDFYLGVNGAEALLVAQSVQVPEFKAGYRYKFTVEMDKGNDNDVINLYLTVNKWDEASWDSGIGGDDTAQLRVLVGSWKSVSWQSGIGGDDNDKLLLSVRGWSSATWSSNIGGSNEDGSNSK